MILALFAEICDTAIKFVYYIRQENQFAACGNSTHIARNFASNRGFLISYPMPKDKTMSNKYSEDVIKQEYDA